MRYRIREGKMTFVKSREDAEAQREVEAFQMTSEALNRPILWPSWVRSSCPRIERDEHQRFRFSTWDDSRSAYFGDWLVKQDGKNSLIVMGPDEFSKSYESILPSPKSELDPWPDICVSWSSDEEWFRVEVRIVDKQKGSTRMITEKQEGIKGKTPSEIMDMANECLRKIGKAEGFEVERRGL